MTYAEKLKDPRWIAFRNHYFHSYCVRLDRDYDIPCEACGEDAGHWHLHHTRYEDSKEPWEYPLESMRLLCAECHREVHEVEKMVRAWILTLKHAALYEFAGFMRILMQAKSTSLASSVARQALYDLSERLRAQDDWEDGKRTLPEE